MPPAFQSFLDDLSLVPTVQQVMTIYDWLLKLSLEISLVWQSQWSLIKCLYLVTRYLTLGDVTIALYGRLAFGLSAEQCAAIYAAYACNTHSLSPCFHSSIDVEDLGMFAAGLLLGELLLLLRVWAIWGKDRRIGVALAVFYGGLAVLMFANLQFFLKSLSFLNLFHGTPGCMVAESSNRLYIEWILLMILDIGTVPCGRFGDFGIALTSLFYVSLRGSYKGSRLTRVVYGEVPVQCSTYTAKKTNRETPVLSIGNAVLDLLLPQVAINTIVFGGDSVGETRDADGPAETLRFENVQIESDLEPGEN
ncbi:hypothetical protein P691DRAFT_786857 [Macrolepiota fuliginosa MF-IS2]|uniref:DUF6533 domain-containing protein n=1 Tax=Macrolepiota fuliginosa MF-IS2 TaxID=1400762 RepID=A0A9P5X5B6_9AGAR|nr:hypothetical protein P691DRAFT_786857 [Macrolepiota fuliginosa MF-IS2]